MRQKPLSARAITTYYLSALMVIASLTIASHLILIYILDHNQGDAAIINVSGRQRMLSQRIASLAAQYRLGDPSVRRELLSAIDEFEKSERALHAANLSIKRGDSASVQLEAIYSRGAEPLDVEVRGFVADARRVAALPPGAAAASAPLSELFAEARSSLLNKLDDVVAIHQRETERVLSQLEQLQLAILGIVLLTLAAEALAIFRPMIARIAAYTTELLRLATIDPLTEVGQSPRLSGTIDGGSRSRASLRSAARLLDARYRSFQANQRIRTGTKQVMSSYGSCPTP